MRQKIFLVILIISTGIGGASAFAAADYRGMSTEELGAMRSTMQTAPAEEREAFRNEWQRRVQEMNPEERQMYLGRPEDVPGQDGRPRRPDFGAPAPPAPLAPPMGIPDPNRRDFERGNGFGAPYPGPGEGLREEERRRYEQQRQERGLWNNGGAGLEQRERLENRNRLERRPGGSRIPGFGGGTGPGPGNRRGR